MLAKTLAGRLCRYMVATLVVAAGGEVMAMEGNTVVAGKARFQVLSPTLVRMEYSPSGVLTDDASVSVIGRSGWPKVPVQSNEEDGWLIVATGKLTVRYKKDSGPFAADNLQVDWGESRWRPGDFDDKNLGGVPGTLDNRSAVEVTDPGPLSRNGWYLLDDSHSALFDKATDWIKPRAVKDEQDWYFFAYGNDYAHCLAEMAKLLGPIPMLPRYCFGCWFGSRASYSADEWEHILKQFRDESLPVDVMVLDSGSTTSVVWSGYDWDYEQMPDPKGFFKWMRKRGVKVTVNEHYGALTRVNDAHFDQIRSAMGYAENTTEIPHDLANRKYAQLFIDLLHKPALDMGMAFWWQDGDPGINIEGINAQMWERHVEYQGEERVTGKRTTCFSRLGGHVGSHRYGVYFTGDLHGNWESLPVIVRATVRGGNQLMPYMNNLCGGVFGVEIPTELYRRWVQFGAFSPILWFHGFLGLRLPWEYGEAGMRTYRDFVGLRYALLPYTYSYSRIAHDTGLPLLRGMYLEYSGQPEAYVHPSQYLYGNELLVAPVTVPTDGKPAQTQVWLPANEDWFDYFTGDIYRGGQTITHECTIERMPVFARAGSIIPTAPKMDYSDQQPLDPLTIDVFAGRHSADFRLYEDDGTSLDYRKGAYAWTDLSFRATGASSYVLRIGPAKSKFKGQLTKRRYVIRIHGLLKPESVTVNGTKLQRWTWDGARRMATIALPGSIPTSVQTVVGIENAGTFDDAVVLQQALNLRAQVRQAKRLMKIKDAELLGWDDIKKPPKVIRETEDVEWNLDAIMDSPKGCAKNPPDFAAIRNRMIAALSDHPFDSTRTLPELDAVALRAMAKMAKGQFTAEEIAQIVALLRGADYPAWLLLSPVPTRPGLWP